MIQVMPRKIPTETVGICGTRTSDKDNTREEGGLREGAEGKCGSRDEKGRGAMIQQRRREGIETKRRKT